MRIARIAALLILTAVISVALVFAGGSAEQKTYKMRMSTNLAPAGTVGKALKYYSELMEKDAAGKIKTTVNFGNELGNQREQVEMCKSGSLEVVVSAPGTGPGAYVPQLQLFDLPYLFKDDAHYIRVLDGIEPEVSKLLAKHNFVAVGGQNMGFRHMLVKKRAVTEPDDLKGLKMRGPNPAYVAMFQALGGMGITTDWNEVYNALSTGVIDGMEASPAMISSMKFQEVAKNLSMTYHTAANVYYFLRKDWYDGLPSDLQKIVMDNARKAAVWHNETDFKDQKTALDKMKAEGVQVNAVKDIGQFQEKVKPMIKSFLDKGPEWADFYGKLTAIK